MGVLLRGAASVSGGSRSKASRSTEIVGSAMVCILGCLLVGFWIYLVGLLECLEVSAESHFEEGSSRQLRIVAKICRGCFPSAVISPAVTELKSCVRNSRGTKQFEGEGVSIKLSRISGSLSTPPPPLQNHTRSLHLKHKHSRPEQPRIESWEKGNHFTFVSTRWPLS